MHRRKLTAEQFADAVSSVVYPVYHDSLQAFNYAKKSPPVRNIKRVHM